MSEVEVLLSVDAGRLPPNTVVFYAADPEEPMRRLGAFLAAAFAVGALGLLAHGAGREPVALMAIASAILAITSTRTAPEPYEVPHKPAALVVTPHGMIVRDEGGLRSWRFDELAEVRPFIHDGRVGLLLVRKDGKHEFLDNMVFRRGERLAEVIGVRLKSAV